MRRLWAVCFLGGFLGSPGWGEPLKVVSPLGVLEGGSELNGVSVDGTTRVEGLDVTRTVVREADGVALSFSVTNPGTNAVLIRSLTFLDAPLTNAFPGSTNVWFYRDSFAVWAEQPGAFAVGTNFQRSFYMGSLFVPGGKQAWTFSYGAPQLWPSVVEVNGTTGRLRAGIHWWDRPFRVDPGETVTFDTLHITGAMSLADGLLAHGRRHQLHARPKNDAALHGYNTWEWFKENITSSNQAPLVAELGAWRKSGHPLAYHVLDNGWRTAYGNWTFNLKRFPEGGAAWSKRVADAGLIPGVWLAPFWSTPAEAVSRGWSNYGAAQCGTYKEACNIDPTDPEFRAGILQQVRDLRAAGVRYFKTDFLWENYWHYTKGATFAHSKYPPERVLREWMTELRAAMGEDAFWLGCGTVVAPCAGLVDAARVGADVKPGWTYFRETIAKRNAARFWMHGGLWRNDQDFLTIRGPGFSKPGFAKPAEEDIKVDGFTCDEALTWAAFLVMTGGPVIWSDLPSGTTDEGWKVVARTIEHGGGASGVPLDLGTTDLPAKWVRRNGERTYVALFNWTDKSHEMKLTREEVGELKSGRGMSVLTGEAVTFGPEGWAVRLAPHASACVLVDR